MIIEWPLNGQSHDAVINVLTSQTNVWEMDNDNNDDEPTLRYYLGYWKRHKSIKWRLLTVFMGQNVISRTSTKLLGIMIDDAQDWSAHFKTVRTSLNQRLFVIRRIARQIPRDKLINVVHSLWVSKLRYGLQLCTTTRITIDETRTVNEKIYSWHKTEC